MQVLFCNTTTKIIVGPDYTYAIAQARVRPLPYKSQESKYKWLIC